MNSLDPKRASFSVGHLSTGVQESLQATTCKKEDTALHFAVLFEDVKSVTSLLSSGVDVNVKNYDNESSLDLAIKVKNIDIVKELIKNGASYGHKEMGDAAEIDNALFQVLRDFKDSTSEEGSGVIEKEDVKPATKEDQEAFLKAINSGDVQKVKSLLGKNVNVNLQGKDGKTPLHLAVEKSEYEVVKLLLERRADIEAVDPNKQTPLHYAVQKATLEMSLDVSESAKVLIMLLENRAIVDVRDHEGSTPLLLAASSRCNFAIKKLLEKGADAKAVDTKGRNALHRACLRNKKGRFGMIETKKMQLLINHGLDVNTKDKEGRTPLHLTSLEDDNLLALQLLENGADAEVEDACKDKALHVAIVKESLTVISNLIKKGADVDQKALDLAEKARRKDDIMKHLKGKGK